MGYIGNLWRRLGWMVGSHRFFVYHSPRYSGKSWSGGQDGKTHYFEVSWVWLKFMCMSWKDSYERAR